MNSESLRPTSTEEIDTYHRDGVLLLKGLFDKGWIELLNKGLDVNCESPTERSRIWNKDASGRTMFYDTLAWREIEEYKKFIFNSPAAQICGQLMKSTTVNFFFDAVFVRSAGTKFETPWHQDEPYWSIEGYDACTLWMPLVPVKEKNCLSFVHYICRKKRCIVKILFGSWNRSKGTLPSTYLSTASFANVWRI